MYSQVGYRSESPNVCLLTLRPLGVAGPRLNPGCEVADAVDPEAWREVLTYLGKVKPLISGAFDSPIVEIEAIYVEIGFGSGR